MRVSVEIFISSLQIGFNVPLKDSKYKTSEQRFQNVFFFRRSTIPLPRKPYAPDSGLTKRSLLLSDGVSERVSEFAIVPDNPFITLHVSMC